jgi:hypothetical protein
MTLPKSNELMTLRELQGPRMTELPSEAEHGKSPEMGA